MHISLQKDTLLSSLLANGWTGENNAKMHDGLFQLEQKTPVPLLRKKSNMISGARHSRVLYDKVHAFCLKS